MNKKGRRVSQKHRKATARARQKVKQAKAAAKRA